MSLRKLKNPTPTAVVHISDEESFPVRGLNPTDILGLYYRHTGQLSGLFEKLAENYQSNGSRVNPTDVSAAVMTAMQDAPVVMAELIALAADGDPHDGENWDIDVSIATRLAFPIQVDALMKIGALTFTSEMPAGKFAALVAGAVQKATSKAATLSRQA